MGSEMCIRDSPQCVLAPLNSPHANRRYNTVAIATPNNSNLSLPSRRNSANTASPSGTVQLPSGSACSGVHVKVMGRKVYGARFRIA